ncbi:hypothetical protein ACFO0N_03025 [Halobium salinum]|uniref:Uncharacterized protein n=1 Tax=Halobium salinum TaxID=1364940 RepID=A0ABD5P7N9_9EURY|nr:hypothetical protein [Halobium salinum]
MVGHDRVACRPRLPTGADTATPVCDAAGDGEPVTGVDGPI